MTASSLKNPISILGYGCVTAAGPTVMKFFGGLMEGRESRPTPETRPALNAMTVDLISAWDETWIGLDIVTQARIKAQGAGVIFASTKGCIDDFIFEPESTRLYKDPLTPILDSFLAKAEIRAVEKICVSNACVSSISAIYLAKLWIQSGRCDDVLVISGDRAGRFVSDGFKTLKVLTEENVRPFSAARSGFFLGTATAVILLSKHTGAGASRLTGIAIESDDSLMTSLDRSAASLIRVGRRLKLSASAPDLIIAHGTGTTINDAVEDRAFTELSVGTWSAKPLVTNVKWSIGHTLGASGSMDVIAACEILKSGKPFSIMNTEKIDPAFEAEYLHRGRQTSQTVRKILVSSLGFGGTYGALQVEVGG